jgi:hypothetical protein
MATGCKKLSGGVAMREPTLRPPFCRQSNTSLHRADDILMIPPHKKVRRVLCWFGSNILQQRKSSRKYIE